MPRLAHSRAVWHLAGFRLSDGGPRLFAASDHDVSIWDPVSGARTAAFDIDSGINDILVCRTLGGDPVLVVASDMGIRWFDAITGAPRHGSSTDDTVWGLAAGSDRGDGETVFGTGYSGPFRFIAGMHRAAPRWKISASTTTTSHRWQR